MSEMGKYDNVTFKLSRPLYPFEKRLLRVIADSLSWGCHYISVFGFCMKLNPGYFPGAKDYREVKESLDRLMDVMYEAVLYEGKNKKGQDVQWIIDGHVAGFQRWDDVCHFYETDTHAAERIEKILEQEGD